jgi:hypothetical protein
MHQTIRGHTFVHINLQHKIFISITRSIKIQMRSKIMCFRDSSNIPTLVILFNVWTENYHTNTSLLRTYSRPQLPLTRPCTPNFTRYKDDPWHTFSFGSVCFSLRNVVVDCVVFCGYVPERSNSIVHGFSQWKAGLCYRSQSSRHSNIVVWKCG